MRYLLIFVIITFLLSCGGEKKCLTKNGFRPHIVRHVNKSKVYWYHHYSPCDCSGIQNDLYAPYGHTLPLFVRYLDNGEILWETPNRNIL